MFFRPRSPAPRSGRRSGVLSALFVCVVALSSCVADDDVPESDASSPTTTVDPSSSDTTGESTTVDTEVDEFDPDRPGAGVRVVQARANWSSSWFQAAIYRLLLEELGYEVTDPAANEVGPATFFDGLAVRQFDFWTETWEPMHDAEFIAVDASIRDKVTTVGMEMEAGGLQGIVIDRASAEEFGVDRIEQIAADPELSARFDVTGDGIADIHGCDADWACAAAIDGWIDANQWSAGLDQQSGSYTGVIASAIERVAEGLPTLVYVWTPSAHVAALVPGRDVVWLSTDAPPPGSVGAVPLGADVCPGQPCRLGFPHADIRVTANDSFLEEHPAAATLLELVAIPMADVAAQNARAQAGDDSESDLARQAAEWIDANRSQVDRWLAAARAAAS